MLALPPQKLCTRYLIPIFSWLFLAFLFKPGASPCLERNIDTSPYLLEEVSIVGSSRISVERLRNELGLYSGIGLDDDLVMNTRAKLLSLGLFKSALLFMRKGSKRGLAKLFIELEDDDSVLTDWALGGTLGVTQSERQFGSSSPESPPLGYRFELIGRNFFKALHRGAILVDVDSLGTLRKAELAYGFPRFTHEGTQFDAKFEATNTGFHYLDALGFGLKGQGLWSQTFSDWTELRYGAAMYVNEKKDFRIPNFPRSVAGPKLVLAKETRLLSFIPREGYHASAGLVLSPQKVEESLVEINLDKTISLLSRCQLTLSADLMSIGIKGYSLRSQVRFDVPFVSRLDAANNGEVFVRLRGGADTYDETELIGSAAIVGLRYHSSGFIAEFGLQITRSPEELAHIQVKPGEGL